MEKQSINWWSAGWKSSYLFICNISEWLRKIFIENNVSILENVEKIFADQIQYNIKLFVLLYGDDTILLDESQFKDNPKCTKTFWKILCSMETKD